METEKDQTSVIIVHLNPENAPSSEHVSNLKMACVLLSFVTAKQMTR
jgi:hypothetical protein